MQVRGKANGLATAVNWTCNLIIATTFLSLADALSTAVTFWLYAVISFAFWVLVVRMVPEVRHLFPWPDIHVYKVFIFILFIDQGKILRRHPITISSLNKMNIPINYYDKSVFTIRSMGHYIGWECVFVTMIL